VLAIYNAQYLIEDVPRVNRLLEAWWDGCASSSTFLENFPVFRPNGTLTQERMPLLHRRREIPSPRNTTLSALRQKYASIDDAIRLKGSKSILHYYCWRGQAFQHSTLHLAGVRADGYEPEIGPFNVALQSTYMHPNSDIRIARNMSELRPPYDVIVVMTRRFAEGEWETLHARKIHDFISPSGILILCGPQPRADSSLYRLLQISRRFELNIYESINSDTDTTKDNANEPRCSQPNLDT